MLGDLPAFVNKWVRLLKGLVRQVGRVALNETVNNIVIMMHLEKNTFDDLTSNFYIFLPSHENENISRW